MDWFPLFNSIRVAGIATVFVLIFATIAAYLTMKLPILLKSVCDVLFTLPLVLPPTVVGYALLCVIGPDRQVGKWITEVFHTPLVMTWHAEIIAAAVVAFPLMYRTVRGSFESFDKQLIYSAQTLGISDSAIFLKIILPLSRNGIIAGTVLSFARALGEYGATSMLAGYIPGKTATISTTVYQLWRTGNEALAYRWVLLNMLLSAIVLTLLTIFERRKL